MPERAIKILKRMYYNEERTTKVINALKQCTYRSDAKCSYDLLAGGLFWEDEVPYGLGLDDNLSDEEERIFLLCVIYLREAITYRASLTEGKPYEELREAWDDLKNKVKEWPGFREERIWGEETKKY